MYFQRNGLKKDSLLLFCNSDITNMKSYNELCMGEVFFSIFNWHWKYGPRLTPWYHVCGPFRDQRSMDSLLLIEHFVAYIGPAFWGIHKTQMTDFQFNVLLTNSAICGANIWREPRDLCFTHHWVVLTWSGQVAKCIFWGLLWKL